MSALKYYILDSETTGFKAGWHEMTELSVIRYDDRVQLTRQIKSEYPERANDQSLQITGRTITDIMKGADREDVVHVFNKFFNQDDLTPEHRCIVAHSAPFDKRFCHALWESVGETFPAVHWLDTVKVGKEWALKVGKQPENYKLPTMLKFAEVNPMKGIHNAESDARNLYLLWKKSHDIKLNQVKMIKRYEHKPEE
jgi:DNA polymerase III epsilon subunit-like protein